MGQADEAQRLARFFGKTGINIATRIMGLILAATAAQSARALLHARLAAAESREWALLSRDGKTRARP